jgi:hypothetical protein
MRAHKRILDTRKQSRIDLPKQNLWFYSEESLIKQMPVNETKSMKNDRANIFNDDYTKYSQGNTEFIRTKKEIHFVVDWQLENIY